jgi:hypothetical protein
MDDLGERWQCAATLAYDTILGQLRNDDRI